ncbi:SigB/SigF/SigG family RNA polymerase sigma factor [Nonomuraea sp. LP-02]|jgi:RNA polymerase sigma-B factor|uniref:RNA polymerase sigma-B factor n=2 Tax=Nonomuraea TaxID=83681 RepID=A0A1I0JNB4_9ACTN|nr:MULTISPECIES: SigB/SigF/SigG family RNA polymerase sigma factor [Nonomuraea]MED7926054.1 SigB/SigF/SigG family RNA polymerase sigma factor [Nonomuraea sp. LP-02]QYC40058.1 RNA polymerase sigma factor SigF [Nonomuraea coxensis DSM 45129]SEU11924.1 RNA polymerase sigma-B factor [Nonomuraea wenchangensis]
MAVLDIALEEMTAEQLLVEMNRPETSDLHQVRIRERLVDMYSGLVNEVTRRYYHRGEPMEDLRQAAYVGLMKAINGFDPELGHEFRGYAMITMVGEVKRHFRDRTWAIRVPRVYQERRLELNKATAELTQTLGHSPTVAELAAKMGISEEDVLLTLDASSAYNTLSLDAPVGGEEDAADLGDFIPAQDDALDNMLGAHAVKPLIDALPERERNILLMRFYGNMTQSEIAAEFGISQMHVSRILRAVLAKLRKALQD